MKFNFKIECQIMKSYHKKSRLKKETLTKLVISASDLRILWSAETYKKLVRFTDFIKFSENFDNINPVSQRIFLIKS